MMLLPLENIPINYPRINAIERDIKKIYRLMTYSREHEADDVLDAFLSVTQNLQELLSIKNAQQEAQNEEEAEEYLKDLKHTLSFIVGEMKSHTNFEKELQLFQLFRLISPEAHQKHPNRYRHSMVQIGSYICPEPNEIPQLVAHLFLNMNKITNPILRAIYFHHELIRVHPYSDGNGRVTRMAKNWMLMFELYPPIFINSDLDKTKYISTLSDSFKALDKNPTLKNKFTEDFFEQELGRLEKNIKILYDKVYEVGIKL